METPEIVYPYLIRFLVFLALINVAVLLGYRRRAAPWHAKMVFAVGLVVVMVWLDFRVWEDVPRDWIGVSSVLFFAATFIYYIIAYRKSPYQEPRERG